MPVRIRLARGGAKKRPFYRIVVADSRRARDGKFIDQVGTSFAAAAAAGLSVVWTLAARAAVLLRPAGVRAEQKPASMLCRRLAARAQGLLVALDAGHARFVHIARAAPYYLTVHTNCVNIIRRVCALAAAPAAQALMSLVLVPLVLVRVVFARIGGGDCEEQ